MRLLACPKQGYQPTTNSERELVRFDVEYLISCLNLERKTNYEIIHEPDTQIRQSPQPDFIIECKVTKRKVAIEHARFFESQEARETLAYIVHRTSFYAGAWAIPHNERPRIAEWVGQRLVQFFDDKIAKGQFGGYPGYERILLARNRWSEISPSLFLESQPHFKPKNTTSCDHFYLIVQRQLLEVF